MNSRRSYRLTGNSRQSKTAVTLYAFKISDSRFDTFHTDDARKAHLHGEIPQALGQVAADLLASDPEIRTVDIVAIK